MAYTEATAVRFFRWFFLEIAQGRKPMMQEIQKKFGLSPEDVRHIQLRAKAVKHGRQSTQN